MESRPRADWHLRLDIPGLSHLRRRTGSLSPCAMADIRELRPLSPRARRLVDEPHERVPRKQALRHIFRGSMQEREPRTEVGAGLPAIWGGVDRGGRGTLRVVCTTLQR